MEIIKSFNFNENVLTIYGTNIDPYFKASEVGKILGFRNIREALRKVQSEYKRDVSIPDSTGRLQYQTLINEKALYRLAFRSDKKDAVKFTDQVCDIVKQIRLKQYELKPKTISNYHVMYLTNEFELQKNVIVFLRQHEQRHHLNIVVPLGEMQDTKEKRLDAYTLGYNKGQPDILLNNQSIHHVGLIIELKNPNGKGELKPEQCEIIKRYRDDNYKIIVSNDFAEIISKLTRWFNHLRLPCRFCNSKFKTTKSRDNHIKFFHRINDLSIIKIND